MSVGLRKIAIRVGGVIGFLLLFSLILPGSTKVERSITADIGREAAFTVLNGFQHWNEWSPWFDRDPDALYFFEGPKFGVGARLKWQGNADVGAGAQEIVESVPYERVTMSLDFGSQGRAKAAFILEPLAGGTRITWQFETAHGFNPLSRYMGLMIGRWVGGDYEEGLLRLKNYLESLPKAEFADLFVNSVVTKPQTIVYAPVVASADKISPELGRAFGEVGAYLAKAGVQPAGPPLAVMVDMSETEMQMNAGFPVAGKLAQYSDDGRIRSGQLYAGRALEVLHVGPYSKIGEVYEKVTSYLAVRRLIQNGDPWEVYVDDPGKVAEADLRTMIYYPVTEY